MSGIQMVWFLNDGLQMRQNMYVLWSKMSGFRMLRLIIQTDHMKTIKSVGGV